MYDLPEPDQVRSLWRQRRRGHLFAGVREEASKLVRQASILTPWDPQDIADDLLGRARMPFWGERTALAPEELPTLKECDLGKTDWIIAFWWRGYRGAPQAVLAPLRVERVRQGNESNEAGVMWAGSPRQDH